MEPDCLSYLPGALARYLNENYNPAHRAESNRSLLTLRDHVVSGYYRAVRHLAYRESYRDLKERDFDLVAEIFCAMHPFNYRVASSLAYSITVPSLNFQFRFAGRCVSRFNLAAYRFLNPPFNDDSNPLLYTFTSLQEFYPGYLEALTPLKAIANNWLVAYAMPKTYERLEKLGLLRRVPEDCAYWAVCVGNYRLARYLKARHPEQDFGAIFVSRFCSKETASWLLENGWITLERLKAVI